MRVCDRVNHVVQDAQHFLCIQSSAFLDRNVERLALDVGHGVVKHLADFARGQNGNDVRMIELRRKLNLAAEALCVYTGGKFRRKYLDDNAAAERTLDGHEHPAHSSARELALDIV